MQGNDIAVSNPSCPQCLDLLHAFRMDRFGIRGFHSVPHATEVPGWISQEIAQRQLCLLRDRLYDELDLLIKMNNPCNSEA
jgi:hypothetical protein